MGAVNGDVRAPGGALAGFGAVLRELRLARGWTQSELAAAAGLGVGSVRDLEQGRRARPRAGSVARLVRALGLDAAAAQRLERAGREQSGERSAVPGETTGGLWVQVLGPVMAWRDGRLLDIGSVRQRAVLAMLALGRGLPVRRETLVDTLWSEGPPSSAVNIVQGHVSGLRHVLGQETVVWSGEGYRLRVDAAELDLLAFEEMARQAEAAAQAGDAAAACGLFERALGLWRGDPVADAGIVAASPVVTALVARRADVVTGFARAAVDAGVPGRALGELRALAGREPLDERAHAWLMLALAGSGQQAAALEVFAGCRKRLDEQLGVRPGPELARAHDLVLRQQTPAPAKQAAPAAVRPEHDEDRPGTATDEGAAASAASGVPRQLPSATRGFVGREPQLTTLSGLLGGDDGLGGTVVISAIGGIAGVGKTTLALRWAHQVASQFPDGQLYVNLRGFGPGGPPVAPGTAISGFLEALDVPAARIPVQPEARAGLYRSLLAGRRMLLVLDNARDSAQVIPLLPGEPGCLVLVTSRSPLTGLVAAEGARAVPLDVLTEAEAHELLTVRLGASRVAAEPAAVREIMALTGRLPLALSIVAARAVAHLARPLAGLAADLRDEHGRLDALEGEELSADVRAAFSWSYQQLSEPAQRMFRLLGLHPGPDITAAAAASLAGLSRPQARRMLTELTGAGLLTESAAGRHASHDLVHAYAAELTRTHDTDESRAAATHRMLSHYLHTAYAARLHLQPLPFPLLPVPLPPGSAPEEPAGQTEAMDWFAAELPILLAVLAGRAGLDFDVYVQHFSLAMSVYLQLSGRWQEWADAQYAGLAAAERRGDEAGRGWAHRFIGSALTQVGRVAEAPAHLQDALRLFTSAGEHRGRASVLLAFAIQFHEERRYEQAVDYAGQALEYFSLGDDRSGLGMALNTLGQALVLLGEQDRAIDYCQQALEICDETGNHVLAVHIKDTLGQAYYQLRRYDQALFYYQQCLGEDLESGGRRHQANVLDHLGDVHQMRGDVAAARHAWQQSLAILVDLSHPATGQVQAKLDRLGSGPGPAPGRA
jgi:DNA-binding SARP family transcriptional activator/tetratricopeptide (TPR) repeat protein